MSDARGDSGAGAILARAGLIAARTSTGERAAPVDGQVAARAPRVSIVINVRNGAAYLGDALVSALAQTYADWELILWDNASTDGTAEVAARFHDPRVRYFRSTEATPLGRARVSALRQARGEWLAFLDHDDVWLPDKLARQMAIADADPAVAIIYGRAVSFSARGRERDFDHRHEFELLPEGDLFLQLFTDSCFIAMSSAVLRHSAVAEVGGIPDWIDVIPDYYLYLELARRHRTRAVQRVVCRYRLHSESLSRTAGQRMHVEALRLIDRWAAELDRAIAARRRVIHSTGLAVEELRRPGLRSAGLARLLRDGSPGFLLSRPLAWTYRGLRRSLYRPMWRQDGVDTVWRDAPTSVADADLVLSVIVVNWKVRDLLRECLRSLERESGLPQDAWEVVVVDNASGDGSAEMIAAEFPRARLVINAENVGFGRANNQAFRICRGRFVLLLNPDTVVLDHAPDRMLAKMIERPDVAALGCRLHNTDGSFQRWTGGNAPRLLNVACHFLLLYRLLPKAILPPPLYLESEPERDVEVGWVSGACLLLRREALGSVVFDERFFMYGEDLELCDRLRRGGWRVMYTPAARIIHHEGRSLARQSLDIQMSKMRSLRVVFAMRNSPAALPAYDLIVMVGFLVRSVAYGIAALFRPRSGYAARAAVSRQFLAKAFGTLLRR